MSNHSLTWREGPHPDDAFELSDEEMAESEREYSVYRENESRCKMILIQEFGAGNTVLEEYFREVDYGASCSWSDYAEMSAEEVIADFIMYKENRAHGTPNIS